MVVIDIVLLLYLIFAVTVFNNPDESDKTCREVTINIADKNTNGFLDVSEIKNMLQNRDMYPLSMRMDKIKPRQIEELLKKSPFISTAQCFKSKDSLVSIEVTQRLPVIRIKEENGGDYYLDDNGGVVPNASYNSDLIIATGRFSRSFAMQSLALLAQTITEDDFWNAQIEQINVMSTGGIELVPRVGEHIVYIGQLPRANDRDEHRKLIEEYVKSRLHRLELFYRYGLPKTGWNKYGYINLEFDNQIICKRDKYSLEDPDPEKTKDEKQQMVEDADLVGAVQINNDKKKN
ncbi:MAG: cell division protein FtsQ [Bacteroidaceae bacterium]|nr:cell division protein FtsQ [Bacteroidaceae bacterium]